TGALFGHPAGLQYPAQLGALGRRRGSDVNPHTDGDGKREVIDAETREPIPRFSVIEGYSYGPGEQIRWERRSGRVGLNGRFSFRLQRPSDWASKVLIEAQDYLPTSSPPFTNSGAF